MPVCCRTTPQRHTSICNCVGALGYTVWEWAVALRWPIDRRTLNRPPQAKAQFVWKFVTHSSWKLCLRENILGSSVTHISLFEYVERHAGVESHWLSMALRGELQPIPVLVLVALVAVRRAAVPDAHVQESLRRSRAPPRPKQIAVTSPNVMISNGCMARGTREGRGPPALAPASPHAPTSTWQATTATPFRDTG